MDNRERFVRAMLFKSVDRAPFAEVCGYWDETILRWHCEGLPIGTLVTDYFGFDEGVISPFVEIPLDMLLVPRFVERTLGEDDRHRVIVDKMGITKRILKTSSSALGRMPQYLDWPVKTIEDFRKIRERFDPEDPRRIGITWSKELIAYYNSRRDVPIGLHIPGFYGTAREFMGIERLLIAFYKDPELVTEIFDFWGEFIVKMIPKALPFKIDYAEIWEDMAYRNGPNISPKLFKKYIFPHYKRFIDLLKKNGVRLFVLDSDGNVQALLPLLIEAGVNCIFPLEAQSDMDARRLRKEYGESLAMMGNFDKRALIAGKAAIRKEVSNKFTLIDEGGYMPSVDHLVPPDVSFSNYGYYVNLLRKRLFSG